MPVDEWLSALEQLQKDLSGAGEIRPPPLERLCGYYEHLAHLAKGYEKDALKLEERLRHVCDWRDEVEQLAGMI